MSEDFRTPAERQRAERNESIHADYVSIMKENPGIKPMRVHRLLAGKYNMSMTQIRTIVLNHA